MTVVGYKIRKERLAAPLVHDSVDCTGDEMMDVMTKDEVVGGASAYPTLGDSRRARRQILFKVSVRKHDVRQTVLK
jgi:hypothetical protein